MRGDNSKSEYRRRRGNLVGWRGFLRISLHRIRKRIKRRRINMKNLRIITSVLSVLLVLGLTLPAVQAGAVSGNIPVNIGVSIPCASDFVQLSGNVHFAMATTTDSTGGFHVISEFNPQGVSGVSTITGDKYQGTGVTEQEFNTKPGYETTFVNRFFIIGQGPGNNYLVHETVHITINANGVPTVVFDNFGIDCI
jgi:hypothetical protein